MSRNQDDYKRGSDEEGVDRALRQAISGEAPPEVESKMNKHFEALQQQLSERTQALRNRRLGRLGSFRVFWAGAGAVFSAAVLLLVAVLLSQPKLSWADVVEKFKSVKYFSATIFLTEDPLEAPEKMEIWVGHERKSRLHHRGRVLFGRKENVIAAYDVNAGRIDLDGLSREERRDLSLDDPMGIIQMIGAMEEFSLDSLLETICGEKEISPPLENAEATIDEDMQVSGV